MNKEIAIIGLGYVGLSLATALSKTYKVYGYDISERRIRELKEHFDKNNLVSRSELQDSPVFYTQNTLEIQKATFFIVTVPTPAFFYELPNLEPVINATKAVGGILKKGDVVVYESTVYPGTTEEVCQPLLEEMSGLRCGVDFNLGYSPERISPHDPHYHLKNIVKVISAQNEATLKEIESVYKNCCDTLYPVSNIRTAEAVKILENTQRDINIACMNEFAQIMHALDLNVHEILQAAKTKWSFVPFKPGFVGGHCIAVDPLYLAFKAKRIGVPHDLILAARKVNDGMPYFIISQLVQALIKYDIPVKHCPVGVFGVTYKENAADIRSSLALKFIKELKLAGFQCQVHDPFADREYVQKKYDIQLMSFEEINTISAAIVVVGHDYYREKGLQALVGKCNRPAVIMDIPNLFAEQKIDEAAVFYWGL
ncbi:protein capL [Legionella birminghamensis]|uniref:Protein capL n=1 Tax=Legionella birminghamensis TaxID=28083 RepID=A0A378I5U5_9GAMM|nr:nucleotide sugar dehydrogenase [Legionella birminghamensis]KTC70209.1 protein capL [Legionella birminghamensis]STX30383.1 protein capL [Legionella birminghamensis]